MRRSFTWADLGAAFSLSNLFFVISWKEIVFPGLHHYLRPVQPSIFEYLAILTNVLILTLFLSVLIRATRSSRFWVALSSEFFFVVLGILAFGPLSYEVVVTLFPHVVRLIDFYVPVAVFCSLFLLVRRGTFELGSFAENLKLIALFLLPFSFLVLLESVRYQLINDPNEFLPRAIQAEPSARVHSNSARKIVWIIFDGLDASLLHAAESNGTNIGEIQRLSEQSVVAVNAYSPNNRTMESIPALLTGTHLQEAVPTAPDGLSLNPFDGSESFMLGDKGDVFSDLKGRGLNSAIVGWYHPYCRIFDRTVSYCYWSPYLSPECSSSEQFVKCSELDWIRAAREVPAGLKLFPALADLNFELLAESSKVQEERARYLVRSAEIVLSDKSVDFLFIHGSIPHLPYIGPPNAEGDVTYYSSLVRVNEFLLQIRGAMEAAGEWENSVLIVSSDHSSRFKSERDFGQLPPLRRTEALADKRIPFIIKLPGQHSRVDYEQTINTSVTKNLILDIFDEKITKPEDLILQLDHLRNSQPDEFARRSTGRIF